MKLKKLAVTMALLGMATTSALAADKGKILVLLSSETTMPLQAGKTTEVGYYLNEFGVPADALVKAGYELVLATPKGNAPQVDKRSVDPQYFGGLSSEMKRIQAMVANLKGIDDTWSLDEVIGMGLDQYDAVFIPGGHAPLIDLANNPKVGQILTHFHQKNKPTAAICHGPITLMAAHSDPSLYQKNWSAGNPTKASNWIYSGYKMTVFSNTEEAVFESSLKGEKLPFYPAKSMAYSGGNMSFGADWQPHVVVDRELITGQNPFSDKALAQALLTKLKATKP
jgi:putative intracellular protease/amidase